jgi:hypothetical protein
MLAGVEIEALFFDWGICTPTIPRIIESNLEAIAENFFQPILNVVLKIADL